ncbi:MAG TPA: SURF1 family protein [Jiangellales bacterium]|nr:SURF1 family protein [Jiangellales bacterium]
MSTSLPARRWVPVALGIGAVVVLCVVAGRWQLDRHEQRVERNAALTTAAAATPVPVDDLLGIVPAPETAEWRQVRAVGRYDADEQLVVRLRPRDGEAGAHVLTPLVTAGGTALLVDRGFVPQRGSAGVVPEAPAPPRGSVEVVARVRLSEVGRGTGGDPATGTVRYVDVPALAESLPYPLYGAWAELVEQEPPAQQPPEPLPPPVAEQGPNLAYAFQWFLFAVVAVVGGVLLLRSEARGGRRPPAPGAGSHPDATPAGADR